MEHSASAGSLLKASYLRLAALELSTKRADQEIMRDFFWTLYSKLDAVAQGLRVVYEVSNRIGSVSSLQRTSKPPGLIFCRGAISKTPLEQSQVLYSL